MLMPGRGYSASGAYRYGFNGKENDNEVLASNVTIDFGARMYDTRIGRWLTVDPQARKLPAQTPYNFCYNQPIEYIDPDGELAISAKVMYDEKTGKYTILSISISDDLVKRPSGYRGMNSGWHDYIDIQVFSPDGKLISSEPRHIGNRRYETTFLMKHAKWFAKLNVDDGVFEDYGGIMWTSGGQTAGSEETKQGRPSFMSNIDVLLEGIKGGSKLATHKFEKKDLLDVLDKFAELITEASDSEPADIIDQTNQSQVSLMQELERILNKDDNRINQSGQAKPPTVKDKVYKEPHVLFRDSEGRAHIYESGERTITIKSSNQSEPDTIRTIIYRKPNRTLNGN
jgi:RHS repeat-associated protein